MFFEFLLRRTESNRSNSFQRPDQSESINRSICLVTRSIRIHNPINWAISCGQIRDSICTHNFTLVHYIISYRFKTLLSFILFQFRLVIIYDYYSTKGHNYFIKHGKQQLTSLDDVDTFVMLDNFPIMITFFFTYIYILKKSFKKSSLENSTSCCFVPKLPNHF